MSITVQTIIDRLVAPVGPLEQTVDTLKSGSPGKPVRKVAVAMTATYAIIKQAIDTGADLIIAHEPTFYNHLDETNWLEGDPVYEKKRELIESTGIAIFRLHDYIHEYEPDGILSGMLLELGWDAYADAEHLHLLTLPSDEAETVGAVAAHLKQRLGIDSLLLAGDPAMAVSRIGFLPGAPGGRTQMDVLRQGGIDLLIAGETNEWETNEYVRDAVDMGFAKALLVTGHQKSEEAGMATVAAMLREQFPELLVDVIASPPAVRRA
ncbi:Nif3-like dinuclear metal center hexameric protein [Paenibacillus methanolicus]|uniref:GTP cyclohydrolase 1 type 2 homolog n=1 Tax=Paenibacillus methanolicus TaxID=582686 RepID=A0A5S5CJD9_9BACL|nr:Nif3-like dinuclear metal center hexameric protein [Paenibacillus methanolicus]TYP78133.1 putative NIF3 family GTP cyclohydrolase 1 type 2 [Paenibacillus methanolicus]